MSRVNKGRLLLAIAILGMIVLNVIPTGSSNSLNANRLISIRLDYFLHSVVWLGFAWLWVFSRALGMRFFHSFELAKYAALILAMALICEYLQKLVPYRSFNPVDLIYNLLGAGFALVAILFSKALEERR